jgi:hypothetical protein
MLEDRAPLSDRDRNYSSHYRLHTALRPIQTPGSVFLANKAAETVADHSPQRVTEITNAWSCTSTLP